MSDATYLEVQKKPLLSDDNKSDPDAMAEGTETRGKRISLPFFFFEFTLFCEFFLVARFIWLQSLHEGDQLPDDKRWAHWLFLGTSMGSAVVFAYVAVYLDNDNQWLSWPIDPKFWALDNMFLLILICDGSYSIVVYGDVQNTTRCVFGTVAFGFCLMCQTFLFRTVVVCMKFSKCTWMFYKIQRLGFVAILGAYGVYGLLNSMPDEEILFLTTYFAFGAEMYFTCNRVDASDSMKIDLDPIVGEWAIVGAD